MRAGAQRRGDTLCSAEERASGVIQNGAQAGTGDLTATNNFFVVKDMQTWS